MTDDYRAKWAEYLNRRRGNRSPAEFARLAGVTEGQLSKWRSANGGVKPETVIAIARTLGDSPLHALVEVGYLQPHEVERFREPREFALDEFTDLELSSEIVRRVKAGAATAQLTEPIELKETGLAPISDLRPRRVGGSAEDLAEVAFGTEIDHSDDNDDYNA